MSELVSRTLELLAESKGAFASAVKNIFSTKNMAVETKYDGQVVVDNDNPELLKTE